MLVTVSSSTDDGEIIVETADSPQYDALVLGGGGMKGTILLGALQSLLTTGCLKNVKFIVGTSIGAVIGYMFILGIEPEEQLEIFTKNQCHVNSVRDIIAKSSLFDMGSVIKMLQEITEKKTGLKSLSFDKLQDIKLCVVAYNFSKRRQHLFNDVYTPNYDIITALRLACTIPFAFDVDTDVNGDTIIDGGICNNLAVDVASEYNFKNICALTVVNNGDSLVGALTDIPIRTLDLFRIRACVPRPTVFELETSTANLSNVFFMSDEQKKNLYERGREIVLDRLISRKYKECTTTSV